MAVFLWVFWQHPVTQVVMKKLIKWKARKSTYACDERTDYNGFIHLVQLVKDWNTCGLGPCELPGHIRDKLVVRQRVTLWGKKAGTWGRRLIKNVLGHSSSRVPDTVIHFSSNIPFVLSTSSEDRGTIRVAKFLSEGKLYITISEKLLPYTDTIWNDTGSKHSIKFIFNYGECCGLSKDCFHPCEE